MTEDGTATPHPLDGRDENECYKTMMSERTVLVTARRELEDNLVKTIIQLSSALIALMAGFISQEKIVISGTGLYIFSISVSCFGFSIVSGLLEQLFSSRTYQAQQELLENFYTKKISAFSEPQANTYVKWTQVIAFVFFVIALLTLAIFAISEAGVKSNVRHTASTASTSTSTSTAAASPTAATAAAIPPRDLRGQSDHQVSSTINATATP